MDKIGVLIVDDHAVVRQGLRTFLDLQEDIDVVAEASNGVDAVEQARRKLPDVVLMDLVMPGMDGFAACQKIIEEDPDAKIIFLTGHSVVDWVRQALSAGAVSFLTKPVEPEDLISLMKSVMAVDEVESGSSVKEAKE